MSDAAFVVSFAALFLAYSSGAVGLCCALMRAGAKLGTINKQSVSIFNAPVATKKLLFKLLGMIKLFFESVLRNWTKQ